MALRPDPLSGTERRLSPAAPRGRPPRTSRAAVERAALQLFESHGFEATTVEEIAAAVGVGRRTIFRYFPSKHDIVWGEFTLVLDRLRADLAAQPDDRPLLRAVADAAVSSNRYAPAQLPDLRRRMTLITTVPALQAHSMLRYADWRDVVARFVAARRGEPVESLVAQTVAHVALGTSIAAYSAWVRDGGELTERITQAWRALTHPDGER